MSGLGISGGWTSTTTSIPWRTSDMYDLYCHYSYIPQYTYWARVAAVSGCYNEDKGSPKNNKNVFLYTKSIDLATMQGGAVLKYDSYFNEMIVSGSPEKATVEISTNGGNSWNIIHNVPPGPTKDSFATWYINLSQYVGYQDVRIGFRYSDQGQNQKYGGWAIDNIEIFRPEQKDLALVQFTPVDSNLSYTVLNNTINHTMTVLNMGLDTVYSFTAKYKRGNSYELSSVITATIPPMGEYRFTHPIPDTVSQTGNIPVTAWVEWTGDANNKNDSATAIVRGAHFNPKKLVLVEEGTGTWNQFGPRGLVYMNTLNSDNEACLVSIHSSDPMAMKPYADYLYELNYYSGQYFLLDRKYVEPQAMLSNFGRMSRHFGYADLQMHGTLYGHYAYIGVDVKPAVDLKGDFKLMIVVTEDELSGLGQEWSQVNGYASGKYGPMGDYHNKPDPVPAKDVKFNYVARAIVPGPDGGKTFATELQHNGSHFQSFYIQLDERWNKNRLRAIAVLYNAKDTVVLNSSKLMHFLNVAGLEKDEQRTGIYPNPANELTNLQFYSNGNERADITVADINGRTLMHLAVAQTNAGDNHVQVPTGNLPAGIYIVNVATAGSKHTLKLQVMH